MSGCDKRGMDGGTGGSSNSAAAAAAAAASSSSKEEEEDWGSEEMKIWDDIEIKLMEKEKKQQEDWGSEEMMIWDDIEIKLMENEEKMETHRKKKKKKSQELEEDILKYPKKAVPMLLFDRSALNLLEERCTSKFSDSSFTNDEVEDFKKFASKPDAYQRICAGIAPSVLAHHDLKKAVACLLFGGTRKNDLTRSDIHLLLLGDRSTTALQFLKFVERVAPCSFYTSGNGLVGITASAQRCSKSGKLYNQEGCMAWCDGGVVCIENFDKMATEDRVYIHDAMNLQYIHTSITNKLNPPDLLWMRTSVLAAADPESRNYSDLLIRQYKDDPNSTTLDKFDMIVKCRKIVGGHDAISSDTTSMDENWLKRYIHYCRHHCSPLLSEKAFSLLKETYESKRERMITLQKRFGNLAPSPLTSSQLAKRSNGQDENV